MASSATPSNIKNGVTVCAITLPPSDVASLHSNVVGVPHLDHRLDLFLVDDAIAQDRLRQFGQFGITRKTERHQLSRRELGDARMQGRRQKFPHPETHFEPYHTILNSERKDSGEERQDE